MLTNVPSSTAFEIFLADRRPALDVRLCTSDPELRGRLAALVDDYAAYALEDRPTETDRQNGSETVRVHFSAAADRNAAANAIGQLGHGAVIIARVDVDNDGQYWAARCQSSLRAVPVGRLVIAPPWDVPLDAPDSSVIVITPSMGFGTGHHPTTRLCLRALQDPPPTGVSVIDLGTGSGVLAIAAARLGATAAFALDSDPDALHCAQANVAVNLVDSTVRIIAADIRQAAVSVPGEVVMANLTGELLTRISETFATYATAGARLILSGFTVAEIGRVAHAFASFARVDGELREGDWACLVMRVHG